MRPRRVCLRGVIMTVSVIGLASGNYFEVEGMTLSTGVTLPNTSDVEPCAGMARYSLIEVAYGLLTGTKRFKFSKV